MEKFFKMFDRGPAGLKQSSEDLANKVSSLEATFHQNVRAGFAEVSEYIGSLDSKGDKRKFLEQLQQRIAGSSLEGKEEIVAELSKFQTNA